MVKLIKGKPYKLVRIPGGYAWQPQNSDDWGPRRTHKKQNVYRPDNYDRACRLQNLRFLKVVRSFFKIVGINPYILNYPYKELHTYPPMFKNNVMYDLSKLGLKSGFIAYMKYT